MEEEIKSTHTIALELNEDNIIIGQVYLASEDYTNLLANDDRFTLAEVEDVNDIVPYKTKYENGQLIQLQDYSQEYYDKLDEEQTKAQIYSQIHEIEEWFNEYDLQVKQYERDTRLGITGTYHIGEMTYTIAELDQEAITKAQQINTLRNQL